MTKMPLRQNAVIAAATQASTVARGKHRANIHLINRRIELDPRKTLGKSAGIRRKLRRKVRSLKVAEPFGNAEMAQVDDRHDIAALQVGECQVGEFPVVALPPVQRFVQRWPVTQVFKAECLNQRKIFLPARIVKTALHRVDTGALAVDGRRASLNTGAKHEICDAQFSCS